MMRNLKRRGPKNDRLAPKVEVAPSLNDLKSRWSSAMNVIQRILRNGTYTYEDCRSAETDLGHCICNYSSMINTRRVQHLPAVAPSDLRAISRMAKEMGRKEKDHRSITDSMISGRGFESVIRDAYQNVSSCILTLRKNIERGGSVAVASPRLKGDVTFAFGERNAQFRQLVKAQTVAICAHSFISNLKSWSESCKRAPHTLGDTTAEDGTENEMRPKTDRELLKEIFEWMIETFPREGISGIGDEFMFEKSDFIPLDDRSTTSARWSLAEPLRTFLDRTAPVRNRIGAGMFYFEQMAAKSDTIRKREQDLVARALNEVSAERPMEANEESRNASDFVKACLVYAGDSDKNQFRERIMTLRNRLHDMIMCRTEIAELAEAEKIKNKQ
jgi:hypothetical protein